MAGGLLIDYDSILHDATFNDQVLPLRAKDPEGVIKWLTSDSLAAWCIPGHKMGPDLLTRVKLSNGSTVLIVVQAKCWEIESSERRFLPADATAHAILSVTPSTWFSGTITSNMKQATQNKQSKKIHAMLREIGKYELLRVVVALPLVPDLNSTTRAVKDAIEADKSLLATIGIARIAEAFSQIPKGRDVLRVLKRGRDEETSGSSQMKKVQPKKARHTATPQKVRK
ncbi:hypothetical protein PIIN_11449 [Serendipita indica DSM 11827]|uniref:Uncharacterized protein n=1 Tax=Serendipita indica (strain DSM 11827) TaxID=1109443 RepID=G4U1M9_SERID|nr:hypothetical protein PIIN_11449 [Serendipita indica DSM 11827]